MIAVLFFSDIIVYYQQFHLFLGIITDISYYVKPLMRESVDRVLAETYIHKSLLINLYETSGHRTRLHT